MSLDDLISDGFEDGICENCGNTGLAGERCPECGTMMVSTGAGLDKYEIPEEEEKYPEDILEDGDPDDNALPLEAADEEVLEHSDD